MRASSQIGAQERAAPQRRPSFSLLAKLYLSFIITLGFVSLAFAHWGTINSLRFSIYLVICVASSMLKVRLPGIRGTMSVNFFFFLVAILQLTMGETLIIGLISAFAQTVWRSRTRVKLVQVLFNLSVIPMALRVAYIVYHSYPYSGRDIDMPLRLALMATAYFVMNTLPIAIAIHVTERKPLIRTWKETYFWVFTYYLFGAVLAGIHQAFASAAGWAVALLILPVIYAVYRSYSFYIQTLESEKTQAEAQRAHAEEVSNLHLRTIEALALAIEAKDQTTHDHLQRVQVYSVKLAVELGLSESDLQAIRAASLLHDIGKLAVPEHIISKPGKLTTEEFEKMKIHPVVGAEILEHVQFPYPVVPIVRHHHERWDGSGYPDGIRAEEIPIGARILSAVDCLDALASDRQYRRALPLDQAMEEVVKLSGKAFDPVVVECLQKNYRKWEQQAAGTHDKELRKLSHNIEIACGAPAAGYEKAATPESGKGVEFLKSIGAARHEAQVIHEMTQDMVSYLGLDEMLSIVAVRLKKLIPHDTFAVYLVRDKSLVPEFVTGDESRLFSSLRIPLGSGISGWVVENRKPIINGNPSVEPGYLKDSTKFSAQRSMLSVPLEGNSSVIGALSLIDSRKEAFEPDHLRILLMIASKLVQSIENSLRYRTAEDTSQTDYLTGLPNARSLFARLAEELERSDGQNSTVCVMVCDLDGFKSINDRLGHLTGNEVLKAIAATLRENCRPSDFVARMGGDEFVLIIRANQSDWNGFVERLVLAIEQVGKKMCGDNALSASIGYVLAQTGSEPGKLLSDADKCMYAIKGARRTGRLRAQLAAKLEALETTPPSTMIQ